mmetsp:Transcript_30248/g.73058  ORF Transcript_30248/g.73058 Transcript_30248/m.73058 type:complete len:266 (+) Transcript_30248:117-914(+)
MLPRRGRRRQPGRHDLRRVHVDRTVDAILRLSLAARPPPGMLPPLRHQLPPRPHNERRPPRLRDHLRPDAPRLRGPLPLPPQAQAPPWKDRRGGRIVLRHGIPEPERRARRHSRRDGGVPRRARGHHHPAREPRRGQGQAGMEGRAADVDRGGTVPRGRRGARAGRGRRIGRRRRGRLLGDDAGRGVRRGILLHGEADGEGAGSGASAHGRAGWHDGVLGERVGAVGRDGTVGRIRRERRGGVAVERGDEGPICHAGRLPFGVGG